MKFSIGLGTKLQKFTTKGVNETEKHFSSTDKALPKSIEGLDVENFAQ